MCIYSRVIFDLMLYICYTFGNICKHNGNSWIIIQRPSPGLYRLISPGQGNYLSSALQQMVPDKLEQNCQIVYVYFIDLTCIFILSVLLTHFLCFLFYRDTLCYLLWKSCTSVMQILFLSITSLITKLLVYIWHELLS